MVKKWAGHLLGGLLAMTAPLAVAQQTTTDAADAARPAQEIADRYLASQILDTDIVNAEDEEIADIEDLVMDRTGKVRYVILNRGGLGGVGGDYLALPIDRLEFVWDEDEWEATLPMSREQLDRAPKIESETYRELSDPEWLRSNAEFFGAGAQADAAKAVDHPEILRATKILKTRIVGAGADAADMGRVEDLVLGRDWRAAYAILGVGGVLNVGSDFIAAPFDALQFRYDRDDDVVTVSVKATAEQLQSAPKVEREDSYGRLADPAFAEQVKSHFHSGETDANP